LKFSENSQDYRHYYIIELSPLLTHAGRALNYISVCHLQTKSTSLLHYKKKNKTNKRARTGNTLIAQTNKQEATSNAPEGKPPQIERKRSQILKKFCTCSLKTTTQNYFHLK
jgi:hypothetical protein